MGIITWLLQKLDILPGQKRIIGGIIAFVTTAVVKYWPDFPVQPLTEVLWWVGNAIFAWGVAAAMARKP